MKQRAKKALTVDKVESQRTGGGTFVRQVTELDEKLIALLGYRASPLCNPYDADASYNNESGVFIDCYCINCNFVLLFSFSFYSEISVNFVIVINCNYAAFNLLL